MIKTKKPRFKLILNMPTLVSSSSKIGGGLFTMIFWGLFAYLWMPLITVIAWALGFRLAYGELDQRQDLLDLKRLAANYSIVVMILGGALLAWALQQYLRYRNADRRQEPLPVALAELADYSKLDERHIVEWQTARRMIARHDEHGKVLHIDTAPAMQKVTSVLAA